MAWSLDQESAPRSDLSLTQSTTQTEHVAGDALSAELHAENEQSSPQSPVEEDKSRWIEAWLLQISSDQHKTMTFTRALEEVAGQDSSLQSEPLDPADVMEAPTPRDDSGYEFTDNGSCEVQFAGSWIEQEERKEWDDEDLRMDDVEGLSMAVEEAIIDDSQS